LKVPTQHARLEAASINTDKRLALESYVAGDAFRMNDVQLSLGSASSSIWRLQVNGEALCLVEIGPKWLAQLAI
jgi:hypothetical protein